MPTRPKGLLRGHIMLMKPGAAIDHSENIGEKDVNRENYIGIIGTFFINDL